MTMATNDVTVTVQPVELRNKQGKLQGMVYAGRYLEIHFGGNVTIYDVSTGRRIEAAVKRIEQATSADA